MFSPIEDAFLLGYASARLYFRRLRMLFFSKTYLLRGNMLNKDASDAKNASAATKIKVMKIQKISWISYNAEKALFLPGYFFFNVLFATFYLKYSTPDSKI